MARIARGSSKPAPDRHHLKRRDCLRCDRAFLSGGPHHRLCEACRRVLAASPWLTEEYSFGYL